MKYFISKFIFLVFLLFPLLSYSEIISPEIKIKLSALYEKAKDNHKGKNAQYIPELAKVNSSLLGIAIVTTQGESFVLGDAKVPFAIESISKPFIYALALQDEGGNVDNTLSLNATGHSFNSVTAIEEAYDHKQNPFVNAGAIATTSLIKGSNDAEKWQRALSFMQKLSDGKLFFSNKVYQSEMATNQHNKAIAELLNSYHLINGDTLGAIDRYTKACSVMVNALQLAIMGATLANQGVNPITHQRILSPGTVTDVLSQMVVNGLYENSGVWFSKVGLPAKSGVGGGLLAIVPHKFAIVVFSPPLDEAGNSVRAQEIIEKFSQYFKLHILF